ncbi:CRAL/TRIO domain containing protein [Lotmaria passim]
MQSSYTSLEDLGPVALSHRSEIEEVKRQVDIKHGYFDAWIYGFLENKKFNIEETVAKLHRRFAMEVNELATYELTDYMRASLRKGIIQEIGVDKAGRVAFYITTKRDFPQAKYRDEQRRTFDMFISYGTRLRKENKRSQIVMLINQDGASFFKNVDMTFEADVALRISKFYPGGVDKMYICKMNRTLAAMAKPIFKTLPAIVSDRIQIIDGNDIKNGVLLDLFDEDVLPITLGGKNDCDNEEHWSAYADRVEKYYAELKRAVNERGLTVKDWELQVLGVDVEAAESGKRPANVSTVTPQADALAQSVRSMALQTGSHEASPSVTRKNSQLFTRRQPDVVDPDLKPLMTCMTQTESLVTPQCDEAADGGGDSGEPGTRLSWVDVVAPLPHDLALFFLEELVRWRTTVENVEIAERYKLLDSYVTGTQLAEEQGMRGLNVHDKKWYSGIPYPLQALYRILLMGVTVLNAIYFIAALVFLAVFCADVIVTIFFGFFVKPSYVFPLSAVLLMVAIQGVCLCSRAVDIISAIYEGKVIPVFERVGSYWGTVAEMLLFCVLVIIQFIIFIVYARRDSPLRGLEVSFCTGWICALLVISATHVFFFTGIFTSANSRDRDNLLRSLPFFIALNLGSSGGDASNEVDTRFLLRTSSYMICGVPLTISMLLGIGFLISRIVSLYVSTFAAAITAAFVVHYYSDNLSNTLNGALMRLTLWMLTIVWLYVTFVFGFRNYDRRYASSVIVASILNGIFVILALNCLHRPGHSWPLRLSFVIVLLYIFSCWICVFPLVSWRMGLFCLAIMVHNIVNVVFAPRALSGIHGSFLLSAAVLLLGISCVLLGWYGTTLLNTESQSLSSSPSTVLALSSLEMYHRYPVCTLAMGADGSVSVVDISLLNEVVSARTEAVRTTDFNNWFNSRGITYPGVEKKFDADGIPWELHRFDMPAAANLTVLVLNNRYAMSSIIGMIGWIDAIALSPLSIFMPYDMINTMIYIISFATRLIPFTSNKIAPDLGSFVATEKSKLKTEVILTATGVAGGFLGAAAASTETQAILFGSPGLMQCARKMETSYERYHKYVLSIGAYLGALNYIGGQDSTVSQRINCEGSALYCMRSQFFSTSLIDACGDVHGRRHVPSK